MTIKLGLLIYFIIGLMWGVTGFFKSQQCFPELGYDFYIADSIAGGFLWVVDMPIGIMTWEYCI